MTGVNAGRIITAVKDTEPLRDRPDRPFPHDPMRPPPLFPYLRSSVSAPIKTTGPLNATLRLHLRRGKDTFDKFISRRARRGTRLLRPSLGCATKTDCAV